MENTTRTPFQAGVVIYSACMPIGYLIWREENPNHIETHPLTGSKDEEQFLKAILKEPVWFATKHGIEEIYADQDAFLFMLLLPFHYRSGNGVAASKLVTVGLTKEELHSWEQELKNKNQKNRSQKDKNR